MKHYSEELPLFAAGQLAQDETARITEHLEHCSTCRAELKMWREVSATIRTVNSSQIPPADLAQRALQKIRDDESFTMRSKMDHILLPIKANCLSAFNILRSQAYLIKREIWPASAGILLIGIMVALLSNHAEFISVICPLIAAGGLAALYGPENDPAHELVVATPTSSWKILLARLSIVSFFNLVLSLLASLVMLLIVPPEFLGAIILGWLTPMAFLSALALFLSLWIGTNRAIIVSYGLWIIQHFQISKLLGNAWYSTAWESLERSYRNFWQSPDLLLIFSAVLLLMALISTRFTDGKMDSVLS
jgi:hypothetical protein